MKLSKQLESEARHAYEVYFDSYIKGDIDSIKSMLVNNYNQIGSAESEVFFNKQEALKFLHETIDQVSGKTEIRNRTIKIDSLKDYILVTDLFDIYVLVEENWIFYSKFRASTLMEKINAQWKFIHQHSSVPDLKAQEGENIAIEKVSKENLELRNAIKRRTVELEHKNRELEIEAAMERVRAKAMAMHSTKDISDATAIVFNELTGLGVDMERCGIAIIHDKSSRLEIWSTPMSPKDKKVKEVITGYVDSNFHPMAQSIVEAWRNNESYFTYTLQGKEVRDYYEKLGKVSSYQFPKIAKYPDRQMAHCFYFEHGNIFVYSEEDLSEEQKQLLHRFTNVFSLTYKRYLDLKNAEAQVREAQIETALERVRSKTMAMHNSQDVGDTVATLFNEVLQLGLDKSIRCGIGILEGNEGMETWSAASYPDGSVDLKMGMLDMTIHPMLIGLKKAWKRGKADYRYDYIGDDVLKYYKALNNEPEYPFQIDLNSLPENEYHRSFFYSEGILFAFAPNPISEEAAGVLNRFAGVFGQTYRRYLDLKNAEAQAREALIEVSLERVRVRAMAMRESSELSEVISTVFSELTRLDIRLTRTMLWIFDENPDEFEVWMANSEVDKTPESLRMAVTYPYHKRIFNTWRKRKAKWVYVLKGDEKKQLDDFLFKNTIAAQLPDEVKDGIRAPEKIINSFSFHNFGGLQADGLEELTEENLDILYRFSKEFDLTYTRFQDLQKAEAQAKEAVKQSSLDRIRAEIASMRTTDDLNRITPLIWRELTTLDVPFFRCGVFIVDDEVKNINVFLSNPSGESLAAWNTEYESIPLFKATVEHWKKQLVYREEWNQEQFIRFMKSLIEHGLIDDQDNFQSGRDAPEYLALQMIPFEQGMLYVGSSEKLDTKQIELVQSLADSFSVAYARYEDFKKLEEAKGRAENTLTDLKAAQNQLIQSEKMASLGELTAGIAHEIQNPLNFVNNFSEVNKELAEELNDELEKGNMEEVKDIARDIIENEQKINHHGKRAEGIVKGMLQHSRSNTGQKEMTDINALADEYLRLAYHGFRAKDKSFKANFKSEFDKSIPKLNVVPQDIGRVILNLINNAFYAVSKASETKDVGFKPEVTLSTKQIERNVEIIVKDNGEGIPAKVRDKIFQPFFTTKPTGSGTGLGLSLSYDIIKAHKGEINAVSNEGEGTEFKIALPINI